MLKKDSKIIIGLIGSYASGKTTVAKYFKEHNFEIIEMDELGHQALIDKKTEIIKYFGTKILTKEKTINRIFLGNIVFSNPINLKKLEEIVHPHMINLLKKKITEIKNNRIIISAAILIKMGLQKTCNKIILIYSSNNILINRAKERNKLSKQDIQKRLKNQTSLKNATLLSDFIIENKGTKKDLKLKCTKIINQIIKFL